VKIVEGITFAWASPIAAMMIPMLSMATLKTATHSADPSNFVMLAEGKCHTLHFGISLPP